MVDYKAECAATSHLGNIFLNICGQYPQMQTHNLYKWDQTMNMILQWAFLN